MGVPFYLHVCQFIAYFVAIISNGLLLFLIKMRAGASFGSYRVLMVSFSIYAIIYANVEILTLPVMYIHGSGMLFYVDSILKYDLSVGLFFATLYCGSLALCISMLSTHFVYRYFAVCRQQQMHIFKANKVYLLFVPPLILFSIWAASIYGNYRPNEVKRDYFRNITKELYDEDIDKIAFIAPLYYTRQEDGSLLFRYTDLFGAFLSCSIMGFCFSTCIFCASKTYQKLHDSSIQMSKKTRSLSKQLFWSLGLQTLLPFFTQYIPVGLVFILPLFEIEVGKYINIVGVTCSLYPALDPLIAVFIIDRFRSYIFGKEKGSVTKTSQITSIQGSSAG